MLRQRLVAAILHRYPLISGAGRIANSRFALALAGEMNGTEWARTSSGALVMTPLDDYSGRVTYLVGDIDPAVSRLCGMLLRPGDVALDIGANIGIVTMLMARLVGDTGRVHAFEPNPNAADMLHASVERNDLSNVKLHRVALGSHGGLMTLVVPFGNIGGASLVDRGEAGVSVDVPVRTLTEMLSRADIPSIRLAKIDVEGYERDVLAGARGLFEHVLPDAIISECWGLESADGKALTSDLVALGYEVFVIARTLIRLRLVPLGWPVKGVAQAHDVLAIKPDAIPGAVASHIASS